MKNLYIENISLTNYRNFDNYKIDATLNPIVIIGPNGSGKTNILEAISLIFPGRGLRHSKFDEIVKHGKNFWNAQIGLYTKLGKAQINNNFSINDNKRGILFNGSKITGNELSKLTSIIWLVPQMDGIFLEAPKVRRKFFDRIVYNFEESHASKISKYEHYLYERAKILREYSHQDTWLDVIEAQIAPLALDVARSRVKILKLLQKTVYEIDNPFPKARLHLEGEIEQLIANGDDSCALNYIINKLKDSRSKDKLSGKSGFGVHRTDFIVSYDSSGLDAKLCSTGQQKALLISIMLAQINLIILSSNVKPIILLDEVFVHLDELRRKYLIDFFNKIEAQIWVTATDLKGIEPLAEKGSVIGL